MKRVLDGVMVLGIAGVFLVGCGDKQAENTTVPAGEGVESALKSASKAVDEAKDQAKKATEQAKDAVEDASKKVQEANAPKAPDAMAAANEELKSVIAQATEMLNNKEYDKAIQLAQKALAIDPNNAEAKSLLEKAKAALAEMAGALQEKAAGMVDNLQKSLPTAPSN